MGVGSLQPHGVSTLRVPIGALTTASWSSPGRSAAAVFHILRLVRLLVVLGTVVSVVLGTVVSVVVVVAAAAAAAE